MADLGYLIIAGLLWNNIVLTQLLGLFPFFGDRPASIRENLVLGLATTAVMVVSQTAGWLVYSLVLVPMELLFLHDLVMVLIVLGSAVASAAMMRGTVAHLWPRVFANGAVLGLVLLGAGGSGLIEAIAAALGAGLGVTSLMVIVEAVSTRPETLLVPPWLRGMPLQFLTLGMIGLALSGFAGM